MIPLAKFEEIKGRIVRIVSPRAVIVDIGTKNGVRVGSELVVYEEGQEITGLDGKSLGKMEYVKANLRVVHAQESFSLAETLETVVFPASTISGSIASSLTIKQTLPVSEKEIEPLSSYDKTVKKGDLVKVIKREP